MKKKPRVVALRLFGSRYTKDKVRNLLVLLSSTGSAEVVAKIPKNNSRLAFYPLEREYLCKYFSTKPEGASHCPKLGHVHISEPVIRT